jgi:hypothetical protein
VRVIDVGVDAKQSLEDVLYDRHKVLWKRNTYVSDLSTPEESRTNLAREYNLVVHLLLDPRH